MRGTGDLSCMIRLQTTSCTMNWWTVAILTEDEVLRIMKKHFDIERL